MSSVDARVALRAATRGDADAILAVYLGAAGGESGLAREADEITRDHVAGFLDKSLACGIALVALRRGEDGETRIVGEIHAYRSPLRVFAHVLGELTIAVHPEAQGQGVGRALFTELLRLVRAEWPAIERVELITRESNARAIALYESLGFHREGSLARRIRRADGGLEADVPMAWLRSSP